MKTVHLRRLVFLLLVTGLPALMARAGNQQRIGSAGASELLIPVGAQGIALVGANTEFLTGIEALYYNPAGLGRLDHAVEAEISHMQYIADINVEYGAVGVQAGDFGTLGFSIKSLVFGDIPVTTEQYPDGTGQTYSPSYLNAGLTYSKLLTDRISVGVTATMIAEKIMSTSATGIAFNVGIQYMNLGVPGLTLGVVVKNIGPTMTFDGSNLLRTATGASDLRGPQMLKVEAASFDLPSAVEIGVGYQRKLDEQNAVLIGGMFRNNNSQDDEYALGAEYSFNNTLFVRGGYSFAPQAGQDVTGANLYPFDYTLGAGVHYPVGGVDLTFDYAYRHVKYFDANHAITLRLGF